MATLPVCDIEFAIHANKHITIFNMIVFSTAFRCKRIGITTDNITDTNKRCSFC